MNKYYTYSFGLMPDGTLLLAMFSQKYLKQTVFLNE
jgi:hypothetical protein